jgi:hypothetical protein
MHSVISISQVLQPSTNDHLVADGELGRSGAEVNASTDPTAPRQTPLAKAYEAAAYLQAYFDMRELARTKAHLMPRELYERVCRVRDYLGWRYNTITLGGSAFEPSDWRAR